MSAYDNVLDALANSGVQVRAKGTSARAQCPVHRSNGLTLSVREGDGKANVKCFAGCETTDVLAEIGLELRDLYDVPRSSSGYIAPRRVRTPWEDAMAEIGIHNPPPVEHLLHRIEVEHAKEAGHE